MEKDGPTHVPPSRWTSRGLAVNEDPEEGVLGDPAAAIAQQQRATAGHGAEAEIDLLTVHGILRPPRLYDDAEPQEHKEMFGLAGPAPRGVAGVLT